MALDEGSNIRTVDYICLADQTWDRNILNLVAKMYEYKGADLCNKYRKKILNIFKKNLNIG